MIFQIRCAAFAACLIGLAVGLVPPLTGSPVVGPGLGVPQAHAAASKLRDVDTALVLAIDVSNSVDEKRYRLQLNGIAAALQDEGVISAILNGPRSAILLKIVTWSDQPEVALPWIIIASKEDARAAAERVRRLPRYSGEFTCMARMLRYVTDKVLTQVPVNALRTVVDVSGDGQDNCNPRQPMALVRDELASYGTIINGLPILAGDQRLTLEAWYRQNVKGGPGSFILPADGFEDFGRAIRQKFVVEITGVEQPRQRDFAAELNRLPFRSRAGSVR